MTNSSHKEVGDFEVLKANLEQYKALLGSCDADLMRAELTTIKTKMAEVEAKNKQLMKDNQYLWDKGQAMKALLNETFGTDREWIKDKLEHIGRILAEDRWINANCSPDHYSTSGLSTWLDFEVPKRILDSEEESE